MNAEFPSGTITLLFTDIEGSTRLLQQLGEEYTTRLAQRKRRPAARTFHLAPRHQPDAAAAVQQTEPDVLHQDLVHRAQRIILIQLLDLCLPNFWRPADFFHKSKSYLW